MVFKSMLSYSFNCAMHLFDKNVGKFGELIYNLVTKISATKDFVAQPVSSSPPPPAFEHLKHRQIGSVAPD